nr:hypothetical protein [Tanacetum cinerariifolium]
MLHPELPRPGDRIVDFPEGKAPSRTGITASSGWTSMYSPLLWSGGQTLLKMGCRRMVKTGSRPRAPHELPLLTLTAPRVIEMDEPAAAMDSSGVPSTIERGHEGIDTNALPKSLRMDHADFRPSGSSCGGKSLAAMQLCLASNVFVSEGGDRFPAAP